MYRINRYSVTLVKEKSLLSEYKVVGSPSHAFKLLSHLHYSPVEQMHVIMLDVKNKIIGISQVSGGTINACIVSPRDIFQRALLVNAANIILAHNHPSGDPTPSIEDITVTKSIDDAGKIMGINLIDHIIIGEEKYVSLKEKGVI